MGRRILRQSIHPIRGKELAPPVGVSGGEIFKKFWGERRPLWKGCLLHCVVCCFLSAIYSKIHFLKASVEQNQGIEEGRHATKTILQYVAFLLQLFIILTETKKVK